jgi:hypothetical protein
MSDLTCEEFHQVGAELALGVADARDGAGAFAHLKHCPVCRLELRQLSDVADGFGALAPAVEPLAGFESRLLARLDPEDHPSPRRAEHRRPFWAAAAAVAALAIGAVGWVIGDQVSGGSAAAASHAVITKLSADGHPVGQVVIETRPIPWISMAVSIGHGDTNVQCQLRTAGGRVITVGWFSLTHGYGYWAAPIATAAGSAVDAAQVVDDQGRVLALARLPAAQLVVAPPT